MNNSPFEFQLVNGLQGDPAVFVQLRQSSEAILFDLGTIDALSNKDVLRVKQVFVSHAHMDHFIGFDRLLRVHVPHKRPLQVFGPPDFIDRVRAKLRSYTWNLIDADHINFEVFEIHPHAQIYSARLSNADNFSAKGCLSLVTPQDLVTLSDASKISAALLDHNGIWSVGYQLKAAPGVKVRRDKLQEWGLKPGPWLGELCQQSILGPLHGTCTVDGQTLQKADLAAALLEVQSQRALVYLTDLAFHPANLAVLNREFGSATDGIIESSFADGDWQRAVRKAHLSTRQSALIARSLGLVNYSVFHISGIYGQGPEAIAQEAQTLFQNLPSSGPELDLCVEAELQRIAGGE